MFEWIYDRDCISNKDVTKKIADNNIEVSKIVTRGMMEQAKDEIARFQSLLPTVHNRNPTEYDLHRIGSLWINEIENTCYVLCSKKDNKYIWKKITQD